MAPRKTKTTKKTAKKETSWQLTTIPLHSWILFWVLILATMALASVCFTAAFRPAENQTDAEALAVFEAVKKNLERQITELEGKVDVAPEPTNLMDEACVQKPASPIDNYLTYVDQKTSVGVRLPFGTGWLSEKCLFPPATPIAEGFSFGPAVMPTGTVGVMRDATLSIGTSTLTPSQMVESLRENPDVTNIRQRTINGITVVSYHIGDLGAGTYWKAFGRTHHYILYSTGWLTDAEAVKIIQSLRVQN